MEAFRSLIFNIFIQSTGLHHNDLRVVLQSLLPLPLHERVHGVHYGLEVALLLALPPELLQNQVDVLQVLLVLRAFVVQLPLDREVDFSVKPLLEVLTQGLHELEHLSLVQAYHGLTVVALHCEGGGSHDMNDFLLSAAGIDTPFHQ